MTRVKLTDEERERFRDALHRTYQTVGDDCWGERTPSCDLLEAHGDLTVTELDHWRRLSRAAQTRLVLSVGP